MFYTYGFKLYFMKYTVTFLTHLRTAVKANENNDIFIATLKYVCHISLLPFKSFTHNKFTSI